MNAEQLEQRIRRNARTVYVLSAISITLAVIAITLAVSSLALLGAGVIK